MPGAIVERITAAIYARVSTADQNNDMQLTDLRSYAARMGWAAIEYQEKESSVKKRPVFQQMLYDARRGKFQVILVWRIDRFARSMKDFVTVRSSNAHANWSGSPTISNRGVVG